jgi:hypothetical protein
MAYTARHGRNAKIWIDTSSAGTMASSGTADLQLLEGKNTWDLDQSVDFVDTTSFGDSTKTSVSGLPNASGNINGVFNLGGAGTLVSNLIGHSSERAIRIYPDFTNHPTTVLAGKAFFSTKMAGSVTSAVTLDLQFQAGPSGLTWTLA